MKKIVTNAIVFMTILSMVGASGLASFNTQNSTNSIADMMFDDVSTRQHHHENGNNCGNRAWSIVASFQIPESASGLAFDGTYLYCGIYGANGGNIYRISPQNGSYSLLFTGPQDDAFGLTYDGQYLWTTHHPGSSSTPAKALKLDWNGNLLTQFDLPVHYISGIGYDNSDFWVARYYPDPGHIYKVNSTGTILQQFTAPDNQPWDLCIENEFLWMADYWGDKLYRINRTTGSLVESHSSEGVDPAGIVYDGQYLWYCDNGVDYNYDMLYKVDLLGSGTPLINVPVTMHDYGAVTVGESVTWNATVQNIGTAPLNITNVVIPGSVDVTCPLTFPLTIPASGESVIPLVFAPQTANPLNVVVTIQSNDPLHPEVGVTLIGNGVSSGPDIHLPQTSHNFGSIRMDATKRWFMEIQNVGDATLIVSNITADNPQFYLDDTVSFPINIDVVDSVNIPIWYQPSVEGQTTANLTIVSNDPDENPFFVPVIGTGVQTQYPIGEQLWSYHITTSYDNSPKAIAPIADVTGDGISDVIVCSEDNYIRCFNGNAHGISEVIWEHEIYAGAVYSQKGLAIIEDIDDDGYQDVIVGAAWGGRLIKAISGKTGGTIWVHDTHEYGSGGWVYQVDCRYDYNGDGIPDVLAATGDDSTDTGPKRVYCLDGLTGISIWERPLGGPVYSVIGVEDFTGDGIPDVLAGASNEAETIGKAVGINGANGNIEWTINTPGSSVWALGQIGDVSGDGIKDVVIGDFSGNIYALNAVNGNQLWLNSIGNVIITRFEILDDVNNNGHPDILPSHYGTIVRVLDGYTGQFIWSYAVADKPANVARSEDINGDGINDVFVGTLYQNNYFYFMDGVDGTVLASFPISTAVDAIAAIPDIVGDRSMEMVVGGRDGRVLCFSGGLGANPIQADFTADVTEGIVPLTVQFTDLSTGYETVITSWKWDFDSDGIIDSEQQHPTWTYNQEGIYSVSLTVSDGEFSDTEIKNNYILVLPGEPDLSIGEVTGGLLKVAAQVFNNGTAAASEVNWSIQIEGGIVLLGRTASGAIESLPAGDSVLIVDRPVFGLGKIIITVTLELPGGEPVTKTATGFLLFFFVLGLQ
ncbi:choice-of-anchor D domain-containing protein [Candidatus Thorarchaeota archaeon]|nr:MAG: choice-of-anchor D domain-containing protein [Candidatus Thorarchaeota archaeon]